MGKSTVFNALTGLHQHTGNWPGKTVASAEGSFRAGDCLVHLVDLPGTYSLSADSPEEEVTRDYLLSGAADVVLAVVDATCLRRNLNLVLQIRQITPRLVVCVNLLDEDEEVMRAVRGNPISMVFQDPMSALNPVYTVGDQIGEAVALHNPDFTKEQVEERVDEMLKLVGIMPSRKHDYPHQFSGGMKQRVVIAMALCCEPELLLSLIHI